MEIILSKYAGFCFGVKRAVGMILSEIEKREHRLYTLGHIIHNEDFNESLEKRGVINISESDLDSEFPENALIFVRTHGTARGTLEKLREKKLKFIDATCPFVSKIHDIVFRETEKAKSSGRKTVFILLGDKMHPEVLGTVSFAGHSPVVVVSGRDELLSYAGTADISARHIILSQTTHSLSEWNSCLEEAKRIFPDLTVYDTICSVTEQRQKDAEKIAENADLMIIVGGASSSNTKKLALVCEKHCRTISIRRAAEIRPEIFKKEMTVGVSAGASTPDDIIKEVIQTMSEINNNDAMSFEEMLNQSFKTLRTGEEVTGVVTGVYANEVHVDLGIKHTGILPSSEVCANESNLRESFHVGDEINVLVGKFNDPEGTVQVSKKKVDARANWAKVTDACENGELLSGKVVSAVKGGVLVSFDGQNLFVPASLTGFGKEEDVSALVGKDVEFKIIETDPARKRAVASVKAAQREKKEALAEKFWSEIAVDKVYTGKVKSLTSYGAFVDLGGVDGMVHITELSWKRIKSPAEVVSVGDEITVYVKEINPETKKISLGYKSENDNPWVIIKDKYQAGDKAKVKVVSVTPFGAFAELIPGIDGLIHISQLSDKRVANPADAVKVGDEVDVKIVDIDYENKKVSLSARALIEEEKKAEEEKIVEENAEYIKEEAPAEPEEEKKEDN